MTEKLYLEDTYQFHFEGLIQSAAEDEKGVFVILDRSSFYPQGGGQPSDQGVIKNDCFETKVLRVVHVQDDVRHYVDAPLHRIPVGVQISGLVDQERRLSHARYHTSGHLLGNIVEVLYPQFKAVKGHSFPGEAYVEFCPTDAANRGQADETTYVTTLQNALQEAIARNDTIKVLEIDPQAFEQQFYKLPYSIPAHKTFRAVQIGSFLPVPCGGTHVRSTEDLGHIRISKVKSKNNSLRISYEVP